MPPARSSAPRAPIAPLLHESLGERVYRTVRDLILSQVFPPGSKLNVEQICRDLGVSRTPVWDSMRRLESEGLVNTVPRQGVFVLNYGTQHLGFTRATMLNGVMFGACTSMPLPSSCSFASMM